MKWHGFTCLGPDIRSATYEAVTAVVSAQVEAEALRTVEQLVGGAMTGMDRIFGLKHLEVKVSLATDTELVGAAWARWLSVVRKSESPSYPVNEMAGSGSLEG